MSITKELGGSRLGSGKKMNVHMHGYERSTHDMSYILRTSMASGTLVPITSQLALPGDTWDIDYNIDVLTNPTVGPLFGSYKVQIDTFIAPIRLYQGLLSMNLNGVGLDMKSIKLPQLDLNARALDLTKGSPDNQQINPSSIFSYLDIRGLGNPAESGVKSFNRKFNAIPWLMYWDAYNNYYANKQEEIGVFIHHPGVVITTTINEFSFKAVNDSTPVIILDEPSTPTLEAWFSDQSSFTIVFEDREEFNRDRIKIRFTDDNPNGYKDVPITDIYETIQWIPNTATLLATNPRDEYRLKILMVIQYIFDTSNRDNEIEEPNLKTFPLTNLDTIRKQILTHTEETTAYELTRESLSPFGDSLDYIRNGFGELTYAAPLGNQEGLAIKTYQSDLFNNWISTEWIDGENGINEITAIDTTSGSITIDEINLSNKIYNMLNRIALSGGSYDDYVRTVWDTATRKGITSPMYMGGLIKELVFQEVVSNAASEAQPLGTLAGRGKLSGKHKGGKVRIKVEEPSYIMAIVSITPRIDYSQGNKWDVNLKTMDDLHKPALDEIGFQDLITDQMAAWDTAMDTTADIPMFNSAGKQPAWINYMTSINKTRGNFAEENSQMWMTLNRRYEAENWFGDIRIKDLTTYIDPVKFNHVFAETRRDAQNFWVQIALDMTARRKMSAKLIPNL